jgi:hypothetical protein
MEAKSKNSCICDVFPSSSCYTLGLESSMWVQREWEETLPLFLDYFMSQRNKDPDGVLPSQAAFDEKKLEPWGSATGMGGRSGLPR